MGKGRRLFLSRIGHSKEKNGYIMVKYYRREVESCKNFDQNALIFRGKEEVRPSENLPDGSRPGVGKIEMHKI